jgi:hypothetical protein
MRGHSSHDRIVVLARLVMEWIILEGGSNPISPFVCLSTLLSLASERDFWL